MKTSSVFAALAAVCASFAWADTSRDVAPEGVFKDGSVILFIGDSITHGGRRGDMNHYLGHGYQAEVAARYLGYRPDKGLCFLNRALSGDTTEKLLKRWENDVFNLKFGEKGWQSPFPERTGTLKPDVVSLLVGINDFYWAKSGKMTLEKYAANLETLVSSTLKKVPGVEMVLCEPFCLREPERGQLAPWRKAARAVAERHNLCFVDFQKFGQGSLPLIQKCLGMHQNQSIDLPLGNQICCNHSLAECGGSGQNAVVVGKKRIGGGQLLVSEGSHERNPNGSAGTGLVVDLVCSTRLFQQIDQ